jgi:uncharacterized protein YydD (DUF2326 family)
MIRKITSTLASFKSIEFHASLNVVLAETVEDGKGKTRNSAGKSSLVELFHFLLASDPGKEAISNDPRLIEHTFSMTYDTPLGTTTVKRSGHDANRCIIVTGSSAFSAEPSVDNDTGVHEFSRERYAAALGATFFKLPFEKRERLKYSPTFRSLISYLIRREYDGAFQDAESNAKDQRPWDQQVNLSFALGLDWRIAREFQLVREKERELKVVRKKTRDGTLGFAVDSVGALRTRVITEKSKADALRLQLEHFVVAEAYNELTAEAAELKTAISKNAVANLADRERIEQLERRLNDQENGQPPIGELFQELQVTMPEAIVRRFEEVQVFHESVTQNRIQALEGELAAAKHRLEERDNVFKRDDARRGEILSYLRGRGAFEDFLNVQRELSRHEARLAELERQLALAQRLEGEKTALEIERQSLLRRLQVDVEVHSYEYQTAIVAVDECIHELYDDRNGQLVVQPTINGPRIRMEIEGDRGGGISNMEIFCFDIALTRMLCRLGLGPRILVHDSHLFDGVDARQVATALEIGRAESELLGFQYIVTMNSDKWERLPFSDATKMKECVLPVKLDDRVEDGGLFGIKLREMRDPVQEAET